MDKLKGWLNSGLEKLVYREIIGKVGRGTGGRLNGGTGGEMNSKCVDV